MDDLSFLQVLVLSGTVMKTNAVIKLAAVFLVGFKMLIAACGEGSPAMLVPK